MSLIFVRTTIIFITLLVIMRLMGKRQIGEMQPFEFVITLLIAELACIPMADSSIPLMYGIVSIITIYLLHQLVCFIDLNCKPLKRVISGKPSIVIDKNGINLKELKSNCLDVSDLIESMRSSGYFSLNDAQFALYEANGQFSVLPEDGAPTSKSLPIVIVDNGKFDVKNLERIGYSQSEFLKYIKEQGTTLKKTLVFTLDGEGNVYFQEKGKKYKTFKIELKEGISW